VETPRERGLPPLTRRKKRCRHIRVGRSNTGRLFSLTSARIDQLDDRLPSQPPLGIGTEEPVNATHRRDFAAFVLGEANLGAHGSSSCVRRSWLESRKTPKRGAKLLPELLPS
jgi:hypothetical protein